MVSLKTVHIVLPFARLQSLSPPSSLHSTVRIWDFNQPKRQKEVIKFRAHQGRKTVPTCCTYSRDAKLIAAPCQDGSLQLWDVKKPFVRRMLTLKSR